MPSKPAKATMSSSNSPASQSSNNYVEQTVSVLSSVASYMRLPALASTVRTPKLLALKSQSQNQRPRPQSSPDTDINALLHRVSLPSSPRYYTLSKSPYTTPLVSISISISVPVFFLSLPPFHYCSTRIIILPRPALTTCIRALIYPSNIPANSRSDVPKPSDFGLSNFEELYIPTDDGEKLSAFYIRGPRGHKNSNITILMFHGNAGNIGHRLPIARMIINYIGCNVFMLEYRGYGSSTGQPDESGLNIDAQTGLNYLRQRAETRDHKLMVYGQSLGGAVAIKLVSKNQEAGDIAGLILENTFLSIRKLIPSVVPPAKYLTLLCHQVWPSESVLPNITKVPTLFISGLQDEIVP